jgi:murein DD-endopeptidase
LSLAVFSLAWPLSSPPPQDDCQRLEEVCALHEPYPYVWGGESQKEGGFDCSGFIYSVFKRMGKPIPRSTSRKYWLMFEGPRRHWEKTDCGYLVWFTFGPDRPFGHIGIVTGQPQFWQSGSSTGPTESTFWPDNYWDRHFTGAKEGL